MTRFQKPTNRPTGPVTITGASVAVRNGDVNKALRTLKKILEGDDRQKELAKREYYEKPSSRRKRAKDGARKRHLKDKEKQIANGTMPYHTQAGVEYMKSKRKRRKVDDARNHFENAKRLRRND